MILKFGIPLAVVSIGGFLYAKKIRSREKEPVLEPTHQEILAESSEDFQIRFLQYCKVKENETALKELKHSLLLQMAKVEFLNREILSMETESQRLAKYLKKLEEVESLRIENDQFLHMKITKLSTKHKRCCVIEAEKTEISRTELELQEKENVIRTLEEEIREYKIEINQIQVEKNSSKMEYAEVAKEVVRLRWTNACLKHKLMKKKDRESKSLYPNWKPKLVQRIWNGIRR